MLALREFMLGYAALHRLNEREPLYRVYVCAFGVLALESVPALRGGEETRIVSLALLVGAC